MGLVLLAFVVASCTRRGTGPNGTSASPSSAESAAEPSSARPSPTVRELVSVSAVQLISRSFGVAVVSDCRVNGEAMRCRDHLAATEDLGGTWSDITPFDTMPPEGSKGLGIEHVFFLDPEHGWVVAGDCAAVRAVLFRTSDGGRTWHRAPTETSSCNAGAGVDPQFVDSTHGWLIHLEPTGSSASIRRTVDGGRTWSRGGDFEWITGVRFLDRRNGWVGGFLHDRAGLFRTTDGGRTWARVPAPLPTCCKGWEVLVDRPTFSDAEHAVMPITLRHDTRSVIAFDVTADGGRTWDLPSVLRPSGRSEANGFPSPVPASIATTTGWWVVAGDPPILYRTDDGGSIWRSFPIGVGGHVTGIAAVDGDRAWLTSYRGRRGTLFVTRNGGRSWRTATPVARGGRPGASSEIRTVLSLPGSVTALAAGKDGMLYAAYLSHPNGDQQVIVRFDPASASVLESAPIGGARGASAGSHTQADRSGPRAAPGSLAGGGRCTGSMRPRLACASA